MKKNIEVKKSIAKDNIDFVKNLNGKNKTSILFLKKEIERQLNAIEDNKS